MKENVAKVTKAFRGAPDDTRKVRKFEPGEKVTGELAIVAVTNGWAEYEGASRTTAAKTAAPENKVKDVTFREQDGRDNGERSQPKRRGGRPRKASTE